jgi:hypothetical protein
VAIEQQFALSPHGFGNYEVRHSGSCDRCHTSQGFVALVTETEPDFTGGAASMNCRTCHMIHTEYEAGDFELYQTSPVDMLVSATAAAGAGGATFDFGGASNTCATCHQARDIGTLPDWQAPMDQMFQITSTHYELHHGPQANWFSANLPDEILFGENTTLPYSDHLSIGCVGCHMGLGVDGLDAPEPVPDGELFHTFRPSEDVCATCHDTEYWADQQEELMEPLEGLGACLQAAGVMSATGSPVVGMHPEPYVAAWLVYAAAEEDGSFGIHNPKFEPKVVEAALDFMEADSPGCSVVAGN